MSNDCPICQPNPNAWDYHSKDGHAFQHDRYALPLTTPELVQSVYPDIENDANLTSAIYTAHAVVLNSIIKNGCGAGYSPEQLELIERWLAAHLYQVQTGIISQKSAGQASESYQMTTDAFLKGSLHGQQAMLLDTNGCLAKLMADTQKTLEGARSFGPQITPFPSQHNSYQNRPIFRK
jgi:hypothetical protein